MKNEIMNKATGLHEIINKGISKGITRKLSDQEVVLTGLYASKVFDSLKGAQPKNQNEIMHQLRHAVLAKMPPAQVYVINRGGAVQIMPSYHALKHNDIKHNTMGIKVIEFVHKYEGDSFKKIEVGDREFFKVVRENPFRDENEKPTHIMVQAWDADNKIVLQKAYNYAQTMKTAKKRSKAPNGGAWADYEVIMTERSCYTNFRNKILKEENEETTATDNFVQGEFEEAEVVEMKKSEKDIDLSFIEHKE